MNWETLTDYDALSDRAAKILLAAIRSDPHIVFGLPTGRTPVRMYERVVGACSREYHCFRDAVTFNLDEYVGIEQSHLGSYCTFMKRHLFDFIDIDPVNAHIPNGAAPDLSAECSRYEKAIADTGGLGLTFLGLGANGHIAFNEPGTPFDSRTRVVALTESTRVANESLFLEGNVPAQAITMGIATILESKSIVLLASGPRKQGAIERLRSGEISEQFPASALWEHPDVTVLVA
jgi:glucosamine-6-phosphate deaminase